MSKSARVSANVIQPTGQPVRINPELQPVFANITSSGSRATATSSRTPMWCPTRISLFSHFLNIARLETKRLYARTRALALAPFRRRIVTLQSEGSYSLFPFVFLQSPQIAPRFLFENNHRPSSRTSDDEEEYCYKINVLFAILLLATQRDREGRVVCLCAKRKKMVLVSLFSLPISRFFLQIRQFIRTRERRSSSAFCLA